MSLSVERGPAIERGQEATLPAQFENLAAFVLFLKAKRLAVTPNQAVSLGRLLAAIQASPTKASVDDLALLMAPVVCTNEAELRRFPVILHEWLGTQSSNRAGEDGDGAATPARRRPVWLGRHVGLGSLFMVCLGMLVVIAPPQRKAILSLPVTTPDKKGSTTPRPSADGPSAYQPETNTANGRVTVVRPLGTIAPIRAPRNVSWLLSGIPFVILLGWWSIRALISRAALIRQSSETPSSLKELHIPGAGRTLLSGLGIRESARDLRSRQRIASRELDVEATLQATLRVGLPTPMFGSHVEPEYLILVDETTAGDHQARLAEEIVAAFELSNVCMRVFSFHGNPEIIVEGLGRGTRLQKTGPRRLSAVLGQHPESRLILLANAPIFFSSSTGEMEGWCELLSDRADKVLLTPVKQSQWSAAERILERNGFHVLSLSRDGLGSLQAAFSGRPLARLSSYARDRAVPPLYCRNAARWVDRSPPGEALRQELFDQLETDLPRGGFVWLAALAVYPEIHWGITLRLGELLLGKHESVEQVLPQLSQLVWLRRHYMPDWFREGILNRLSAEEEQRVREQVQQLLDSVQESRDARPLPLKIAGRRPTRLWTYLSTLWSRQRNALPAPAHEDYVFLQFMSWNRVTGLSPKAPRALLRLLYPRGQSLRGLRAITALVGATLVAAALFAWLYVPASAFEVAAIRFSEDGTTLVSVSNNGLLQTRNAAALVQRRQIPLRNDVILVAYSATTERLATSHRDGGLTISGGNTSYTQMPFGAPIKASTPAALAWSKDGKLLVSTYSDTVIVQDGATGNEVARVSTDTGITAAALSPDGRWVAAGLRAGQTRVWDIARSGNPTITLRPPSSGATTALAWSPDSKLLAIARQDGEMMLWNVSANLADRTGFRAHAGSITALDWSPDGNRLAAGFADGAAQIWDLVDHKLQDLLEGHTAPVTSVAWSPDSKLLATSSLDKTARTWVATTGAIRAILQGFTTEVKAVAWSSDRSVTTVSQRDVQFWDVVQLGETDQSDPSVGQQSLVAMSANGSRLISRTSDGRVLVWDRNEAQSAIQLENVRADIDPLISRDGTRVVAVNDKDKVSEWNVEKTGSSLQLRSLKETTSGRPLGVAWAPKEEGLLIWSAKEAELWYPEKKDGKGLRPFDFTAPPVLVTWSPDHQLACFVASDNNALFVDLVRESSWNVQLSFPPDHMVLSWDGSKAFAWKDQFRVVIQSEPRAYPASRPRANALVSRLADGSTQQAGFTRTGRTLYWLDGSALLFCSAIPTPLPSGQVPPPIFPEQFEGAPIITVEGVASVAFDPASEYVAVVKLDGMVRVWDANSAQPTCDPLALDEPALSANFIRPEPIRKKSGVTRGGAPLFRDSDAIPALAITTRSGAIHLWSVERLGRAYGLVAVPDTVSPAVDDPIKLLRSKLGFEIQTLKSPTRQELLEAFDRLPAKLLPHDLLVLILIGEGSLNGAPGSEGTVDNFTLTLDGKGKVPEVLTGSQIRDAMAKLPVKRSLLMIDADFSDKLIDKVTSEDLSNRCFVIASTSAAGVVPNTPKGGPKLQFLGQINRVQQFFEEFSSIAGQVQGAVSASWLSQQLKTRLQARSPKADVKFGALFGPKNGDLADVYFPPPINRPVAAGVIPTAEPKAPPKKPPKSAP